MSARPPPDHWDDDGEAGAALAGNDAGLGSKFSNLNVNAVAFVPNVNAPAFVPSFMQQQHQPSSPKRDPAADSATPVVSISNSNAAEPMQVDEQKSSGESSVKSSPARDPKSSKTAESWEDVDQSESTPATTPEDEDTSMTDDPSRSVPASKPKTKVKPKVEEATTTEKEHVNVVFIGHVDAGKSTIGGQMMYLTGMVDKRTLEKYEREAKEKNRETWYLSWCMDTNLEEREKGKTVEVGRGFFETEKKHFTILDAPGHKSFVPNMIGGASQADLAVLVISARKGEFETGFERGGQTREHAMLVKTAGVKHMVVLVNKMDDPTVQWDIER